MFPFLAPIGRAQSRFRFAVTPEHVVEIEVFTTSPNATIKQRSHSGNSDVRTQSGSSLGSRPQSRHKSKSPLPSTSPRPNSGSSGSAKSSPIPPTPAEVPPPISRHRNKGLETSSAMLEMFGGGGSAFGAGSAFEVIPPMKETRNFGRKNVLERELAETSSPWENQNRKPNSTGPVFYEVEDHEKAYERAQKKSRGNQFDQSAQPGPEWFTGFDKMELNDVPVSHAVVPEISSNMNMDITNITSPESPGDWKEAKENVFQVSVTKVAPGEPGPDLGDDDDYENVQADESCTQIAQNRRRLLDEGADAENAQSRALDAEDVSAVEVADAGCGDSGATMSLLIKGAQVVNDDSVFAADVLIQDGVITKVAVDIEVGADAQVIDANGRMLLPAGIDVHTHLTAPESADDLATGCKAALAGGTGTVIDMVYPKNGESLTAAYGRIRQTLDKSLCNIALSVVIKTWSEGVKKDMEKIVADGVNSFIIDIAEDDQMYHVLEFCRSLGAHARILPENKTIVPFLEKKMLGLGITGPEGYLQSRPEDLESERVNSICVLSQITNCPISILSLSSVDSLSSLERSKCNGSLSHAEIATAAVATDGTHYFNKCLKHATGHLTDVPLRTDGSSRLVAALASQPLVVCTSGHRAINSTTRLSGKDFTVMPKGVVGVEERLAVIWEKAVRTGRIDPMRFVAITSTNAAKTFNLYPKKGRIAVGADADLVIWDTTCKRKLGAGEGQSSVDINIYEGMTVHAQAAITIVGGHVAWKDGNVKDARGSFVSLTPNSPYLFSVVQQRDKMGVYEKVDREPVANGHKKSNTDAPGSRGQPRKSHFESNIEFGSSDNRPTSTRVRNPPGGRTTGFW
ncbi:unnamed protein product [Auanema sp. JU1783]|nr:unnamed protein product [Auanema sp. JU1783]